MVTVYRFFLPLKWEDKVLGNNITLPSNIQKIHSIQNPAQIGAGINGQSVVYYSPTGRAIILDFRTNYKQKFALGSYSYFCVDFIDIYKNSVSSINFRSFLRHYHQRIPPSVLIYLGYSPLTLTFQNGQKRYFW